MADNTLVGIFDRHHSKICLGRFNLHENIIDTGHAERSYRVPEVLVDRLLSEGAFRAQVGNFQWFLLRHAHGHDFPEQA